MDVERLPVHELKVELTSIDNELDGLYVGLILPEHPWFVRLKDCLIRRRAVRLALKDKGAI